MPELADTKVEIVVLEGQSAAIQGKGGVMRIYTLPKLLHLFLCCLTPESYDHLVGPRISPVARVDRHIQFYTPYALGTSSGAGVSLTGHTFRYRTLQTRIECVAGKEGEQARLSFELWPLAVMLYKTHEPRGTADWLARGRVDVIHIVVMDDPKIWRFSMPGT